MVVVNMSSLKSELKYDPEIEEMAKRIREENKKKLTAPPSNVIVHCFNRPQKSQSDTPLVRNDYSSLCGRFGWSKISSDFPIPYIFRNEMAFCSSRMVEMGIHKTFPGVREEIFSCIKVLKFPITKPEAKLFNEINFKHCDAMYGTTNFTEQDYIIKFEDAQYLSDFIKFCVQRLTMNFPVEKESCRSGFLNISNSNVIIPYVNRDEKKLIPVFYLEGELHGLEAKKLVISGWDLAYLKFCFKIHGIKSSFYAADALQVIELNEVIQFFPPQSQFVEYWPPIVNASSFLNQNSHDKNVFNIFDERNIPDFEKLLPPPFPDNKRYKQSVINGVKRNEFVVPAEYGVTPLKRKLAPRPMTVNSNLVVYCNNLTSSMVMNESEFEKSFKPEEYNKILFSISDISDAGTVAYQPFSVSLNGKMVRCVNAAPGKFKELLVPVEEIRQKFFPVCKFIALAMACKNLGCIFYKPNRQQYTVLAKSSCDFSNSNVMVTVATLMNIFPQLVYISSNFIA